MRATGEQHLVVDRLEKRFGHEGAAAVKELSLVVREGELLGILGPSGCGKTTTLRMIAGLTSVSSGHVRVRGKDVTHLPAHLRDMGVVFQSYALFPHMTVARNLAFGLEMRSIPRHEIARRVQLALDRVQLGGLGDRHPRELSGGQQQRVALARALVIEPSILLLDEPLSNLDAHLREQVRAQIRDIQQSLGMTSLFVTHDQAEALAVCDRIAILRAGVLEQIGTPRDIYERPVNAFVAGFVGRVNAIDAFRDSDGAVRVGSTVLSHAHGPAGSVVAMVRPHRIAFADGAARAAGMRSASARVQRFSFTGDVTTCEVEMESVILRIERPTLTGEAAPRVGEIMSVCWRDDDILVYPAAGIE